MYVLLTDRDGSGCIYQFTFEYLKFIYRQTHNHSKQLKTSFVAFNWPWNSGIKILIYFSDICLSGYHIVRHIRLKMVLYIRKLIVCPVVCVLAIWFDDITHLNSKFSLVLLGISHTKIKNKTIQILHNNDK